MRRLALLLALLPLLPLPALAAGPSLEQYYNSAAALDALPQQAPDSDDRDDAPTAQQAEAPPAPAPEAPPGGKSHVVTSVMKCYEEIGREAALEIRRTSLTPYADCQRKLREMEQKKAADKTPAAAPVAETPRNFVRVTEGDDSGHEEKAPAPAKKQPAARK